MPGFPEEISRLVARIRSLGKENLEEMLHLSAEGIGLITSRDRVRVYVEDLTSGALACAHASGRFAAEIRSVPFPIISRAASVSGAFTSQYPAEYREPEQFPGDDRDFCRRFSISAAYVTPVASLGKSFAVVAVDQEQPGEVIGGRARTLLGEFLGAVAERLDHARKYHQQLLLARRIDEYKKREAALLMVESAVRLIDRISLASVVVPTETGTLATLASHSPDQSLKRLYDEQGAIALRRGASFIGQFIRDDGVIIDERMLRPLYIADLSRHPLQMKALTEEMALRSMYVVPRYEEKSRKVICLVNYFTHDIYRFSEFEMGLLQSHAEMVESAINEVGGEHLEIRVLAEINDLLQERNEELQPFLSKVLSKATELIGADTGSVAVVTEREAEKWLVVEDEQGKILGAKNKEWLKRKIPPFRIGGTELPPEERSLTGFVAWAKRPKVIEDVGEESEGEGFHKSMNEAIRSEIAVPFISDDETIAVICLNSLKIGYFTEEHRKILELIGRLTSRHISDIQRIERLQGEVRRLATDVGYKDPHVSSYRLGNIIGNSRKAQEIVEFINTVSTPLCNRIALWNTNILQEATIGLPSILVLGQTGSGKEFFFNNLYSKLNEIYRERINPSGELPVKKTNIAAYSGELTYSELFGHKKGAFTGAYSDRKGILEEAQGGIVFLDEIGDADPKTQVQLLRFLDNGGFVRLGENQERFSRVLLVAATNRNLEEEIRAGNFREDLFHRLSELSVRVPSLNERREDIPDLSTHFLGKLYRTYRGRDESREDSPILSRDAREILVGHDYRGNIRELRSILLRALFFRRGRIIGADEILQAISDGNRPHSANAAQELNERIAAEVVAAIGKGADFWSAVYDPFSRNELSRDAVLLVVEKARTAAGRTMPEIARHLRAVTGDVRNDPEERKNFFRFKNFLYKTVKV
jgi:transcriptional regulator with GAF, ATPase, and Fis domain